MRVEGAATSAHEFNNSRDIADARTVLALLETRDRAGATIGTKTRAEIDRLLGVLNAAENEEAAPRVGP